MKRKENGNERDTKMDFLDNQQKGDKIVSFSVESCFCKLNILQRDTLEYLLKNATTMFARACKLQLEPHY